MDPVQISLSLLGVIAIIALVRWAMGSAVAQIVSADAARDRIAWDHPDFVVDRLVIASDGHEAIALSADGREAIVLFALGNRITLWRIPRQQLHIEGRAGSSPNTLIVATGDFTLPYLRLPLADATLGSELASRLGSG